MLGERHVQRIFTTACFGPTKTAKFIVVVINGEAEGVAVQWFAKFVALVRLSFDERVREGKWHFYDTWR